MRPIYGCPENFRATKSEGVGLIVRAVGFQDFQPVSSLSTKVTVRQTDKRHVIAIGYRALHYSASRRKNRKFTLKVFRTILVADE